MLAANATQPEPDGRAFPHWRAARGACTFPPITRMPARSPILLALGVVGTLSLPAADFDHEIVPMLRKHCAECHTGDKKKGGFSMNTAAEFLAGGETGAAIVPGKSAESLLVKLVTAIDRDERMPPKRDSLTPAEVATLSAWIDAGAPWTGGFAFKKPAYEPPLRPRQPDLPPATDGRTHPVDRLIDARLAHDGTPRPAPLGDGAFFRRVHLDLVGLLPEPEALQAFLADPAPDKRARVIDSLLANNQDYAEHWLTFWNDLLRNDYAGTGYIDGGRKQISAWLYQALLENKPYDAFVRELIAPTPASEGFARGIKWRGEVSAGQTVPIQFAQSVGQAFLGINLKCASCHDSFIDRWKLDEAYGLAAVFSAEPLQVHRCDVPAGRVAKPAWLFPELGQIDAAKPPPERLQQLAALMTHPENGRLTRTIVNRLWHRLMGRGIVHPVDAMQSEPWHADLLDFLATDLAKNAYDLKSTLRLITTSAAYQSASEVVRTDEEKAWRYAGPRANRLTAEEFTDAIWQLTGTAPGKIDAPVQRPGPAGAAATAKWIWTNDQREKAAAAGETAVFVKTFTLSQLPRAATAAVTCDNAFELVLNGRSLGSGDTWTAPQTFDLLPALRPGGNELVVTAKNGGAGPNLAGLLFEARLTDGAGAVSSVIASDTTWKWRAGADSPFLNPAVEVPDDAWKSVRDAFQAALAGGGKMVRASLVKSDLLMRALGRPNREQIVTTRPNDLTTLEAMDLNNGAVLTERLEKGAAQLLGRKWASREAFVTWLWQFAYCRQPSDAEMTAALAGLGPQPSAATVQDLLWAVVMQPEFQTIR